MIPTSRSSTLKRRSVFGNGKTKPAAGGRRAGTHVPELGHVLSCGNQFVTASNEAANGRADCAVLGVRPLHEPQQNATVNKDEHQSWSS
jgi:hypothetical protein